MATSLSSHSDGTATNDIKIKEEVRASSARHPGEDPFSPLTNNTTSHEQKATKPNSSHDSSLISGGQDTIKKEDDVNRTESAQHMQTRQASRLNKAPSAITIAANPIPLPQVRSDVTQLQPKKRATTTQAKSDSKEDLQEKDRENAELKKSLQIARSQLTKESGKLSGAERKIEQLKEELKKEKEKVKSKRDEYQKKIKSGPITMGDDGQMYTLLSRLGDMCEDWAAKYAIPDEAGRKYNNTEKSNILNLLKIQYNAVSDPGEAKIFDGITNCAELLLNAGLTHLIWFEILDRPFYFLGHAGMIKGPDRVDETLKWLVDLGDCSGDIAQKSTYYWLGTLVKTLNPSSIADADGPLEKTARSKIKTMKDAAFKELGTILKRHCGVLFRPADDGEAKKRDARLLHICRQAHDTAQKLWTQGYKIKCLGRDYLLNQFLKNNDNMRAHLTMLIDDTTTTSDGQEVYLVTKPLVRAYGNEIGEFLIAQRTLDPATVCIAAKEDLKEVSRSWSEEVMRYNHSFVGSGTTTNNAQQLAQKDQQEAIECAMITPRTEQKQQAASGFPSHNMSPTVAKEDVSSNDQTASFSRLHALDPTRTKNDHSAPDEHTQNLIESTTARIHLREKEFYLEQVNVKTGKRKRVGMYVEVFEDAEASAGSIADVSDNDEPIPKKGRNRRRGRNGQKETANQLETPGEQNETIQVPSSKPNPLRTGASKILQCDNTTKK